MAKLNPSLASIAILILWVVVTPAVNNSQDTGSGIKPNSIADDNPNRILNIVKGFPAPGDGDARGLAWDGAHLWMAEDDSKGLYMIDTLDGTVLDTIPTPGQANTQGVAWDGSYLWHAEYDGSVYKIDPVSEVIIDTITGPTTRPTGLTWDGTYLWVTSYIDDKIFKFSPADGALIQSFNAPAGDSWGLTWSDTSLWNVQLNGDIYELDQISAAIKKVFPSTFGSRMLGLTTDGNNLWIVDGDRDSLFKLDIVAVATTEIDYSTLDVIPDKYQLGQNFPNPFNPSTTIQFTIPEPGTVKINVYSITGRHIETLLDRHVNAGDHTIEFRAKNLSSGIYYYRIAAGGFQAVRKMIYLK